MKQLVQSARRGKVSVANVPVPAVAADSVLVKTVASWLCTSENSASEFARRSLLGKAWTRRDLVRHILAKARRQGMRNAIGAVMGSLEHAFPLGHCSAGTVVAVGEYVDDLKVGDDVVCAGAGHALHADYACVPRPLVKLIPKPEDPGRTVSLQHAALAPLGACVLQGLQMAEVGDGSVVAVVGLGLVGQLAVQLLGTAGCRVLALDIDPARCHLAARHGAERVASDVESMQNACLDASNGAGVDAVFLASGRESTAPLQLAALLARHQSTIVALSEVAVDAPDRLFYEKELALKISHSCVLASYGLQYGPTQYGSSPHVVRGMDSRNLDSFLQLLMDGRIELEPLITHRIPLAGASQISELLTHRTKELAIAALITYDCAPRTERRVELRRYSQPERADGISVGFFGAGSFSKRMLMPMLGRIPGVKLVGICAGCGINARHAAMKFGFRYCTSDEDEILADSRINTVVIATRHHQHARQVARALSAQKHVFCEKPLCLEEDELAGIIRAAARHSSQQLMVGFNRRFAPMSLALRRFLEPVTEALVMQCRVNAGYMPRNHWRQDITLGGGRIIGEVCHYIDWMVFLANSPVVGVQARTAPNIGRYNSDNVIVDLELANGSLGTITYLANGDSSLGGERLEVSGGGISAVLDNFRCLELFRNGRRKKITALWRRDRGHRAECEAFVRSVHSGVPAVPLSHIVSSTLATIRAARSVEMNQWLAVDAEAFIASALNPVRSTIQKSTLRPDILEGSVAID